MAKKKSTVHPRRIKFDPNFIPCTIEVDEEYLRNGIFVFNITSNLFVDFHLYNHPFQTSCRHYLNH